jgi:hypothetical protein
MLQCKAFVKLSSCCLINVLSTRIKKNAIIISCLTFQSEAITVNTVWDNVIIKSKFVGRI